MAGGLLQVVALAALLAGESTLQAQTGVRVIYDRSPVWQQPDVTGPRLAMFDRGAILTLDRRHGDWYAILLPDTSSDGAPRRGFMLASAVELVDGAAQSRVAGAPRPVADPPRPVEVRSPSGAQGPAFDPPDRRAVPRQGLFVGYGYAVSRHDGSGDFDGGHVVYYPGAISVIPRLVQGSGIDLMVGYRRARSSIELRYRRTRHDAAWAGLSGSAVAHTLDTSWKVFLLPRDRVQPYLSFDVGMPWLRVDDGLVTSARGARHDGEFIGVGGGAGAGLTVFAHPRVGVSLGGGYRYDVYLSNRREDGTWAEIDESVKGRGLRFTGGVTFTF